MADAAQLPETDSIWLRFWWLVPLLLLLATGAGLLVLRIPGSSGFLPGYISSLGALEQEYVRFNGRLLQDEDAKQQFQQAAQLTKVRDYVGAIALLEGLSKKAAVPAVFNDLGVLYAQLDDRAHAVNAFREALARDIDYQPVRANLKRLRGVTSNSADPVTTEVEPNNSNLLANLIITGTPVEAEISPNTNDVDCFRFTAPPPPRDILAIEIANHSKTLAPVLTMFNADRELINLGKEVQTPGESLVLYITPRPNATLYLDISGYGQTSGAYVLTVRPMKAFDTFEPNDDIMNASRISVGQPIAANIMDGEDTDFYSFISPRTGTLSIDIANRSGTLIPAVSTYTPDMRLSGFGPDIRTPGEALHHTIEVQTGFEYYIQVWSQGNSAGEYTLTVH